MSMEKVVKIGLEKAACDGEGKYTKQTKSKTQNKKWAKGAKMISPKGHN